MSFDKDLETIGAAVENDAQEHTARMSHALAEFGKSAAPKICALCPSSFFFLTKTLLLNDS